MKRLLHNIYEMTLEFARMNIYVNIHILSYVIKLKLNVRLLRTVGWLSLNWIFHKSFFNRLLTCFWFQLTLIQWKVCVRINRDVVPTGDHFKHIFCEEAKQIIRYATMPLIRCLSIRARFNDQSENVQWCNTSTDSIQVRKQHAETFNCKRLPSSSTDAWKCNWNVVAICSWRNTRWYRLI